MVRLQTRMMAVLRGLVFACLRVNASMSWTPVLQRVSVAAQRLAMLLCIEWSCEVSCWGVGARMGLATSTPCMSSPCGCRVELRWRVHGRVGEGVLEQLQDGECAFQETARDGRCCRVPSRSQSRASEQYGRWSCVEAVTRGCYPVETIVELYIKATLGGTTAVFMYPQNSMG